MSKATKFICHKAPSLKVTIKPYTIKEMNGVIVQVPGKRVQFEKGLLITDDPQAISRMREHPWFGNKIVEITPEEQARIEKRARVEAEVRAEVERRMEEEEKTGISTEKIAETLASQPDAKTAPTVKKRRGKSKE